MYSLICHCVEGDLGPSLGAVLAFQGNLFWYFLLNPLFVDSPLT